jgi:hypothetical protein
VKEITTMTANPNPHDLPALPHSQQAEPDVLCSMFATFVEVLMSADADAVWGADSAAGRRIG